MYVCVDIDVCVLDGHFWQNVCIGRVTTRQIESLNYRNSLLSNTHVASIIR